MSGVLLHPLLILLRLDLFLNLELGRHPSSPSDPLSPLPAFKVTGVSGHIRWPFHLEFELRSSRLCNKCS